jgi:hypothetical protein
LEEEHTAALIHHWFSSVALLIADGTDGFTLSASLAAML